VIRFDEVIADAYVTGGRNIAVPSTPGRQVRFLAGHAQIKDGRDMVAMMRLAMVKLVLTPYALDWFPEWAKQARDIRAEILRPQPIPDPEPAAPPDPDPALPLANWDPTLRPNGADGNQPGS
jgi:hypothetical protein